MLACVHFGVIVADVIADANHVAVVVVNKYGCCTHDILMACNNSSVIYLHMKFITC